LAQRVAPLSASGQILLVEDDPGDARVIIEAFGSHAGRLSVVHVESGDEALRYLRSNENALPDLVLLDLNLPGMSGMELLGVIKSDAALGRIPALILTNSQNEQHIAHAHALQADCYLVKPFGLEAMRAMVHAIERFWFATVTLATPERPIVSTGETPAA
jgi:CheY-like chemotaxis protein